MHSLRRNSERRHIKSGTGEMWLSFFPQDKRDTIVEGFGGISIFNEYILQSSECILSELIPQAELVMYIQKGALALDGPKQYSGVITAGEFLSRSVISSNSQRTTNTSRTDPARFFRIYLRVPSLQTGGECADVPTRFTTAQRHNVLCTVASPDARKASLRLTTDTRIYSSILDNGQHIVHELLHGRKAWLHVIYGKVTANEVDLAGGDGMGITGEPAISVTVKENSELLLIDTPEESGAQ